MLLRDPELLEDIGLTAYERKTLVTVMALGVADAATLCREGEIPTSKIYRAMEKLAQLGLVQIQPTRPKMYAALSPDAVTMRAVEIARERAEHFAVASKELRTMLGSLAGRARGRQTFVDLALGVDSHIRRHLTQLAAARSRIVSYMEQGDLSAIDRATESGFPVLRRIARNAAQKQVQHQVVFGFSYQSAGRLVEFLRRHKTDVRHLTGVRYSGELGHPFHVVDEDFVVLPLDHPFVPEGRFASLLVRDRDLAQNLAEGFDRLWRKAMRGLHEIDVDPRPR